MNFRSVLIPAFALGVVFAGSAIARAGTIDTDTYTFEAPDFTVNEATPITAAPNSNVNDPTFTTTFSDQYDPDGAVIGTGLESAAISGQFLGDLYGGFLELTFSEPVYYISLDFAIDDPYFDPFDPFLLLGTDLGGVTFQPNENVTGSGGFFADGIVSYYSSTPFTSVELAGGDFFSEAPIAIDNVVLYTSPVPEPSFLPLVGVGLAGLLVFARRSKQRAA